MFNTFLRLAVILEATTICCPLPLPIPHADASRIMSIPTISALRAHSHRSSVAALVTHRFGRHRTARTSVARTRTTSDKGRKAVLYDVVYAIDSGDTEGAIPIDREISTSTSPAQEFSSPTGVSTNTGLVTTAIPTLPDAQSASPDGNESSKSISNLSMSRPAPSHDSDHSAIIPALIGSAVGATLLIGLVILVVYGRQRVRKCGSFEHNDGGLHHWFSYDKENIPVFIRVPPPTVPLKGILIRNPSSPLTPTDDYSDRISLTSSQLSAIINNLPKSYDSGLEDGVLDEVREGGRCSPIRAATRIGPSPSDFLANLFGHTDSFSSGFSSASGGPESFSQEQQPPRPPSRPLPQSQPPRVPHSVTAPSVADGPLARHPAPTFPLAAAFGSLGLTSGPRGHGLVLTGDQNAPVPSFAQWHYQRTMARGRDGNSTTGYKPQF